MEERKERQDRTARALTREAELSQGQRVSPESHVPCPGFGSACTCFPRIMRQEHQRAADSPETLVRYRLS